MNDLKCSAVEMCGKPLHFRERVPACAKAKRKWAKQINVSTSFGFDCGYEATITFTILNYNKNHRKALAVQMFTEMWRIQRASKCNRSTFLVYT